MTTIKEESTFPLSLFNEYSGEDKKAVDMRSMLEKAHFNNTTEFLLGESIDKDVIISDFEAIHNILVGGTTGFGKTNTVHQILLSMMYHATPNDVKLGIIDLKQVDYKYYNDLPYMIENPIGDVAQSKRFLEKVYEEMERRYRIFSDFNVGRIKAFNQNAEKNGLKKLPYWVIAIDECMNLFKCDEEVKALAERIMQQGYNAGIFFIASSQTGRNPIMTGSMKKTMQMRIAKRMENKRESYYILDSPQAVKLEDKNSMWINDTGQYKCVKSTYISDEEIERICRYLKNEYKELGLN